MKNSFFFFLFEIEFKYYNNLNIFDNKEYKK